MFNFLKKKPEDQMVTLKITGMHCSSCAMSIDGELEDLEGVHCATTNYAAATTKVEYDAQKVDTKEFSQVIKKLGYEVTEQNELPD